MTAQDTVTPRYGCGLSDATDYGSSLHFCRFKPTHPLCHRVFLELSRDGPASL